MQKRGTALNVNDLLSDFPFQTVQHVAISQSCFVYDDLEMYETHVLPSRQIHREMIKSRVLISFYMYDIHLTSKTLALKMR